MKLSETLSNILSRGSGGVMSKITHDKIDEYSHFILLSLEISVYVKQQHPLNIIMIRISFYYHDVNLNHLSIRTFSLFMQRSGISISTTSLLET